MRIDILTLFPEMFVPLKESIIGRAKDSGKVQIEIIDIRDYTLDKHKKCDDYPFGGGAGMLMMPQPIADAIEAVDPNHEALRIYTSPKGKRFEQKMVSEKITVSQLAKDLDTSRSAISRILDPENTAITLNTIEKVAKYLGKRIVLSFA